VGGADGPTTIGFPSAYAPCIVGFQSTHQARSAHVELCCLPSPAFIIPPQPVQEFDRMRSVLPLSSLWFPTVRSSLVLEAEGNRRYLRGDETGRGVVVA